MMDNIMTKRGLGAPERKPLKLRTPSRRSCDTTTPPKALLKTWILLLDSEDSMVRENAKKNIFSYYESIDAARASLSDMSE